jgi:hypothetical protein
MAAGSSLLWRDREGRRFFLKSVAEAHSFRKPEWLAVTKLLGGRVKLTLDHATSGC